MSELQQLQDELRAAYVAEQRKARAAKEALMVPGSRWRHQQNRSLSGTLIRLGSVSFQGEDKDRVWLMLDGTAETYRCPPGQLVDAWNHEAPPPADKPAPPPPPPVPGPPDTLPSESTKAAKKASPKKKATKKRRGKRS